MNTDNEITTVMHAEELREAATRMMDIRFECLVRMFDSGFRQHSKSPQYFKLQHKITLEGIKYSTNEQLGRTIKELYAKLEEHIQRFENQK